MVYRPALFIGLFATLHFASYSQCVVSQDEKKRVITTCQVRPSQGGLLLNRPDRSQIPMSIVYLGSEYLTFPIWQDGTLELGKTKKIVPCKIAYNLVTNEVKCRFEGDSVVYSILPDAFTVDGKRFISQLNTRTGKSERTYYMVLYAGKTKLLKRLTSRLVVNETDVYDLNDPFDGTFEQQKAYYIQKNDESPKLVTFSRKSVLNALDDQSGRLPQYLTKKKLTIYELTEAVAYYDGFR